MVTNAVRWSVGSALETKTFTTKNAKNSFFVTLDEISSQVDLIFCSSHVSQIWSRVPEIFLFHVKMRKLRRRRWLPTLCTTTFALRRRRRSSRDEFSASDEGNLKQFFCSKNKHNIVWKSKNHIWTVVVAQLVEQLLPTPEIHGSSPFTGNLFTIVCIILTLKKRRK